MMNDSAGLPDAVGGFSCSNDYGTVTADVTRTPAGLAISRIELRTQLPEGITHKALRAVPLGEILAQARSREDLAAVSAARPIRIPPLRHAAMTDELLRDIARAYLEESSGDKDRAVVKRLEERFGRPRGTIVTWISRARKEGWLGPATRGRVGAEPGPKLAEWLSRIQNCETCRSAPPAGFACRACGAEGETA